MTSERKRVIFTIASFCVIGIAAIVLSAVVMQNLPPTGNPSSLAESTSNLTASEITKRVISSMEYEDLKEVDNGNVSSHFNLPEGSVTQASVYISTSADSALEIDCFKLSDESQYENVSFAVAEHMLQREKGFTESVGELELIKNYVMEHYGGYVFVAVAPNAEAAAEVFRSSINNKG